MSVSNLELDENIQFITGAAWQSPEGDFWNIPVRVWAFGSSNSRVRKNLIAWSLETKYGLKVTEESQGNFDKRINYLIADNERGKKIVIEIAGQRFQLNETDARGHSETIIILPIEEIPENQRIIEYRAVLQDHDQREFVGTGLLLQPEGVSIISDIDDTVKLSEVTDRAKLFDNTFYKGFIAIPGMSEVYRELESQGASLHFISSSPWQLYPELDEFLDKANFPTHSIVLKTVRFKDRSFFNLFKGGDETKPEQIEPLFRQFPKRKFIMIGDSGEEDAKVYTGFLERYSEQVVGVFIRDVNGGESIEKEGLHYFSDPQDILGNLNRLQSLVL